MSAVLVGASSGNAQSPAPSPIVTPTPTATITPQQKDEIEKIVDERLEKNAKVDDRIQATVNGNFSWAIGLLTALIAALGVMPIIIIVLVWLLRGSVIQQIVSETKKQLEKDIELEVKKQFRRTVAEELAKQVDLFKQELESLKIDFIDQLQNLSLSAQQEKDRIFDELERITPSVIQTEFVSPEIQKKIQELTRQLEILKIENSQLSLSYEDYIKQGDALYFEGRYLEAVVSFDKAIQLNPDQVSAWIGKGKVLRKAKQYQDALMANEKAIELSPDNYWSWFGKGYTLTELHRHDEALNAFDQAIAIEPRRHYGWRNRGYVLTKLGRYQEALLSFSKALELNSTSSGAYYWRAYWYVAQNQFGLAIEQLKRAVELNPSHREFVKADPDFDPIRENLQFQEWLASQKN